MYIKKEVIINLCHFYLKIYDFLNLFVQYNNTFTVFISKFVPLFMKNLKITAKKNCSSAFNVS